MNINLLTAINDRSYGVVGTNILKSLNKAHRVSLFPLPTDTTRDQTGREVWNVSSSPDNFDLINRALSTRETFDYNAPSVRIWHQNALFGHVGKGKRVGMSFFELDRLKPNEVHQFRAQDLVIVPSKWAAQVVKDSCGPIDVRVVPLGYDPEIFYPRNSLTQQLSGKKSKNTIIFSAGKWEYRKGHDVLVEMFNKAFTEKDPVELWLSCNNPFLTSVQRDEWERLYLNSRLGSKIKLIPWTNTQKELAEVMSLTDFGVFPSRAEGWGLECLEMMAMGKEVIVTNYSGHTEYCFEHNTYLIDCPHREPANDAFWFHCEKLSDGAWASIGEMEIDQAVEFMRMLHKDKQEGRLIHSDRDVEYLTWDNAAAKLVEAIT